MYKTIYIKYELCIPTFPTHTTYKETLKNLPLCFILYLERLYIFTFQKSLNKLFALRLILGFEELFFEEEIMENDMMINQLKATELRLGLPGTEETNNNTEEQSSLSSCLKNRKRQSPDQTRDQEKLSDDHAGETAPPPAKAQIVGWPPIRSHRKNNTLSLQQKKSEAEISGMFVKVSMDGAPYLRKIDLRVYKNYPELLKALENMFKFTVGEYSEREGYKGSDYVPTYEDKDGDWMLVGDVPWDMFMSSCKRMRIMRESEARGLGCGV